MKEIVIGTRGSALALWQAEFIKSRLQQLSPVSVRLSIIRTQGDKIDDLSFDKMEGKGFFTKEIEDALLTAEIDLAVHSLKDLMTSMPAGLTLSAVGFREDSREAVVIRKDSYDDTRPLKIREGGVIGSSSVRRQCQIAYRSPDLQMRDLRGNVPTRIRKLREGRYDAIVVAYAGLKRLNLDLADLQIALQAKQDFLPAPGQGILAIQTRENDRAINALVSRLDDPVARVQVQLERGLLARFQGGCQLPLGACSEITGDEMTLSAILGRRERDRWVGLTRAVARGKEIDALVESAYNQLTDSR